MGWSGLVTCDGCGREFRIEPKVKPLKGGGEEHFFRCPNKRCRRRYVTARITAEGVRLRREIERARGELGRARGERRGELARLVDELVGKLRGEVSGA